MAIFNDLFSRSTTRKIHAHDSGLGSGKRWPGKYGKCKSAGPSGFCPLFRHARRRRPNVILVKAGRILDPAQMHLLLAHHVRLGGKKVAMKKDGA